MSKLPSKWKAVWLLAGWLASALAAAQQASAAELATAPVRSNQAGQYLQTEAVTEAVRQTQIAAQVAAAILEIPVKAGQHVKKNQLLIRMDARAAVQQANAGKAQVEAARATLAVAQNDYQRQQQLFAKNYISQAQMDQAEARLRAAAAEANAQIAQAGSVATQSGFYSLNAPYDAVLADIPAMPGDMVMPGKILISLYDPAAMRVSANVPQSQIGLIDRSRPAQLEIAGLPEAQRRIDAGAMTILPAVDAATHTVVVRFDLPAGITGVTPGMFARLSLPLAAKAGAAGQPAGTAVRLFIPAGALFRRAEVNAVYVLDSHGKALLRQVRPGPQNGSETEILAGLAAGERVVLQPQLVWQAGAAAGQTNVKQ